MITRIAELPVGHVLERLRVWLNTNPKNKHVVRNIYQKGGIKSFYDGLSWNLMSSTLKTGTRWINTYASDKIISNIVSEEQKAFKAALIGISSSIITTTVYCPFERMKVFSMTTMPNQRPAIFTFNTIYKLMNGWRPMFTKEATISVVFNVSYSQCLKFAKMHQDRFPFLYNPVFIGAAAGSICAVVTTPLDMVKDQMQMSKGIKEKRLLYAARELYQEYGFFSMVRTVPIKVARSAWYFGATTMIMNQLNALPKFMQTESAEDLNNNSKTTRNK